MLSNKAPENGNPTTFVLDQLIRNCTDGSKKMDNLQSFYDWAGQTFKVQTFVWHFHFIT